MNLSARIALPGLALLMLAGCGRVAEPAASTVANAIPDPPPSIPGETWDPWDEARTRGIEFRALGNEPGWFLEIDEQKWMRLLYDYGERQATTPVPVAARNAGVTVYAAKTEAHALRVAIETVACSDGMSDASYPETVIVTIDGVALHGCGRWLTQSPDK